MIEFYHKVFYHLYKLAIKSGEKTAPLTSVIPTISFLQVVNIFCILTILDILGIKFLTDFLDKEATDTYITIIICVVLMTLNYVYFTSEGREKSIVKEYSKKSIEERKKGARITLIYSLVSIVLIYILAPLRG